MIQEEKFKGPFANFRIVIRKKDESYVKAPIKHSGRKEKEDLLLDILNKPELNEWKPVEIEIVNSENIETKTPDTKERQTKYGDVKTYDRCQDFPNSKDSTDDLSKKVNDWAPLSILDIS